MKNKILKMLCLISLCVSFCDETSQDNTTNSQNAAVESKQISQNSNKIVAILQNKTINSKNPNLQISQNETKSKNANLQILASNDKIATVYKGEI